MSNESENKPLQEEELDDWYQEIDAAVNMTRF
jgi:hypothetical protein